jgi:hypothetical protein
VFASVGHFDPSLIFEGKDGAYPSGPLRDFSLRVGSMVEVTGSDKHNIIIQAIINS